MKFSIKNNLNVENLSGNKPVQVVLLVFMLALLQIFICTFLANVQLFSVSTYLVLHESLETIAIAISILIFALGWNAHAEKISGNLVWLGCVFFMIGWLDLSHTESYPGMPAYFSQNDSEKHLYFWILARFLGSLALLGLSIIPWSRKMSQHSKHVLFIALGLCVLAFHWMVIEHQNWLPHLFVDGAGLTSLKREVEFFFIAVNISTIGIIFSRRRHSRQFNYHYIVGAAAAMVMSGLFFTLYTSMTGVLNLAGHIYKVVSYFLIYRSVVADSIEFPFRQLEDARNNLQLAVEASAAGMVMVDSNGVIVLTNARADAMFGYEKGALNGESVQVLFPLSHKSQHAMHVARYTGDPVERKMGEGRELLGRRRDGSTFRVEVGLTPISRDRATFVIASIIDISSQVESDRRINQLVNFDPLTGLPNRNFLKLSIENAIDNAVAHGTQFCILFMDVDHFKNVNDSLGHRFGDELLVEVGRRLRSAVRQVDTVSRMGGDEFLIILPTCKAKEAAQVAEKLLKVSSQPYRIGEKSLNATLSIGIAAFPGDGKSFDELYQHADAAMYRVKRDGRNGFSFFTQELQDRNARILELDSAMHVALREHQFYLEYQPQLTTQGRKVIGLEALLRWRHPTLGQISPVEFIPIAEESGLIIPLGTWVIQTAVRQMRSWIDQGMAPRIIAVNLSAIQFRDPDLLGVVSKALEDASLPSEFLELELTESVTMGDPEAALAVMDALHSKGIRMSIDDFGTGYSSLSYLKRFKIYKLKIDKSFIRDIAVDADDRAIVSAIIQMAHGVGFETIAEGVETDSQLDFLVQNGCDEIQGYLFCKPIPALGVLKTIDELEA